MYGVQNIHLEQRIEQNNDAVTYKIFEKYTYKILFSLLTLRLLISYIYGAPSKARNANVVYIWTYVWQRW